MPLQEQVVSLPFQQGVDTKTDSKLATKLSRLENMVFRGGTLAKRYGTSLLSSTIDTGGSFTAGEALFPFYSELVRINSGAAYGLGGSLNAWVRKPGGGHYATLANTRLIRNGRTQYSHDTATTNGVTVLAWWEVASGNVATVHVAVYDDASGAFYQGGNSPVFTQTSTTAGSATTVRCVAVGNRVLVFFVGASNIRVCVVDTTVPESALVSAAVNADQVGGTLVLDAVASGSNVLVCYPLAAGTGTDAKIIAVNSSGTQLGSPAPTTLSALAGGVNSLGIRGLVLDSANTLYVFFTDQTAGTVNYLCLNSGTLASVLGKTTLLTSFNFAVATVAATTGTSPATISLVVSANIQGFLLKGATVNNAGVTVAAADIAGTANVALASGAFSFDSTNMVAVTLMARNGSNVQTAGYVMDFAGNMVASFLAGGADSWLTNDNRPRLPSVSVSNGTAKLYMRERGRLAYASDFGGTPADVTPLGITRCVLTLTSAAALPVQVVGRAAYLGGALPRIYDGQQVVEAGFYCVPDGATASLGASGQLSAGSYQYRVVFAWASARGELQRSAPSPAVSVTATALQKCTLTIPVNSLSCRDAIPGGATQVEVYRTTANGTVFYRVSSVDAPTLNVTNAATVTFVDDTVADTGLVSHEPLYTTGNVYDNIAPPPFTCACEHKGRLFIGGLEDSSEVRFSAVSINGELLRFNDAWSLRLPASAGPVTGLASLDDKLVVFAANTFFLVFGDGPDLLGNNPFSAPQPVVGADSGAQTALSILETPAGVLFQSAKGLSMLDRGLNVSYFGADVEAYGQMTVRSAVLRPEVEQIWVQADNGSDTAGGSSSVCLVYDYHYNQWSVLTGYGAQDACYYQGKYTRVRSDGFVFQEQPGTYTDPGGFYFGLVETAWLKPSGLVQGFQRIWRVLLLGTYGSDFTLLWDAAYNYDTTYNGADTLQLNGSGIFTVGGLFQLRRLLRQQKCEAVKFRFSELALSGTGQGMALTSLDFSFGVRAGAYKLSTAKSIG